MARKEKKYHFIYKTTNLLNGKYYIGMHSTNDLDDGYMGSGKRLRYSVNKYGKENHNVEVLEFFEDRKKLTAREKEIITLNEIAKEECMNLMIGGKGGFISDEQQISRSTAAGKASAKARIENKELGEKMKKVASVNFIKAHVEGKIKYNTFVDRKHSEETKKLMSEIASGKNTGEKNSQFGTCWIKKNNESKKVKKENLNIFLQSGWVKGRVKN